MPSDERKAIALDAIRPRTELFHTAVATTTEQVRGLLTGTGKTTDDESESLGFFGKGKIDVERFASFTPQSAQIDDTAEAPIRAAQDVLNAVLAMEDDLFVLELEEGEDLSIRTGERLAQIGRVFAAARVIELAKRGAYVEDEHGAMLGDFPFHKWNKSERALAPGLVIELSGADFKPAVIVPLLDAGIKLVFKVEGDAPAAALSRVVSPGVFVQQETGDQPLEAFAAFEGTAVAALLPKSAASFVHDPLAGETTYERFVSLTFPKEVQKRSIGGISATQQAEDYALLETLGVVPSVSGEAASDPAGKLSAWLLSQTDLSNLSA